MQRHEYEMPRKIKGKPNYFGKQLTELHKTIGYTQQQPDDYPFYESKSQYPPVNLLVDLTKEHAHS